MTTGALEFVAPPVAHPVVGNSESETHSMRTEVSGENGSVLPVSPRRLRLPTVHGDTLHSSISKWRTEGAVGEVDATANGIATGSVFDRTTHIAPIYRPPQRSETVRHGSMR